MFHLTNIEFANPAIAILLGILPLLGLFYFYQGKKRHVSYKLSSLQAFKGQSSLRGKLRMILPLLRLLALGALIIALARPRATLKEEEVKAEAVDIILVTDLSSSMLARDFKPDRLETSKEVAIDFINKREYDRLGLTVFAGEAFTQCPLTTDHAIVKDFVGTLRCGLLEDGTAIGLGLASALNRLKESEAVSKVVILLTDGENNAGEYVKPMTAADIAKELGVKVYTIGIGTIGQAYAPIGRRDDGQYVFGYTRVNIDEDLLKRIASETGGRYFRATDRKQLEEIYDEIDRLEKTKIEVTTIKRYTEMFHPWLILGLLLLGLEMLLRYTLLRTIP